ncbi:MAG: GTP-binding protein [Myxococcota bacterium]|nr:GTP-binding protein [Myxococcota bacterium]
MSERAETAIAVTVVTGFLGAGKTTLLNRWLGEHARGEVAVIVNEIGAIGIDGELLAARVRTLVEITGGCLCCATNADLMRALADLAARAPAPRRIFIETSGAASPAGVLRAIARGPAADALRLDGVITVVDPRSVARLGQNELAAEQVGYADVLVLSRADECDPAMLTDARAALASRNGTAVIATASRGELRDPAGASLDALLARRADDLGAPRFIVLPREVAHAPAIESISLMLEGEIDDDRFADWVESQLARFEGRLLRMKGILAVAGLDERMILQGVADQVEVTFGAPWADAVRASRIVLVGFGLEREELESSFARCAAG